jgi:hypothetical protein
VGAVDIIGAAADAIVARAAATAVVGMAEVEAGLRLLHGRPAKVCEALRTEPPVGAT